MKQIIRISAAAALALLGTAVFALEWPVQAYKPESTFGQRLAETMERGLIMRNEGTVRAASHGELLITLKQNRNLTGFPGTLGNAVILSHDDGLRTIYGNLDNLDQLGERDSFETGSIIANTGASGWGTPTDCLFQVFDQEKKTTLNPLMLLPSYVDTKGPIISDVTLVSVKGQSAALGMTKSIKQGKWRLYAAVSDMTDGSPESLGPFRVSVLLNGAEVTTVPFELLRGANGKIWLSDPVTDSVTFYQDPGRMYLGTISLTRGKADVSIIARDTAGNERSVLFGLQIE